MVESTTETLPSADITEPNVPSNTSKDKEESTSNQTDAGQLKKLTLHLMKQINRQAKLILQFRINHQHLHLQKQKIKRLRLRIVKS